MRGKPAVILKPPLRPRITPAHAGKTRVIGVAAEIVEDHPRACGENLFELAIMLMLRGSPPRMRGKLYYSPVSGTSRGITPAHAGKTFATVINVGHN